MKKIIYSFLLAPLMFLSNSCELANDLDDFQPLLSLDASKTIVDERSAESVLAGVYVGLYGTEQNQGALAYTLPDFLSGYIAQTTAFDDPINVDFATMASHNINTNNPFITTAYQSLYNVINRANWFIEGMEKITDTDFDNPERYEEFLAEAKIIRALGHYYLLRSYGQFYDVTSTYGIAVRTTPAKSDEAFPRNTVAETYTAIISDLDAGIANAPDNRSKQYANKTFAKGLKAKILLYQGQYTEAAMLAKEVIDSSPSDFSLTPAYFDIFGDLTSTEVYESSEVLFGTTPAGDSNNAFNTPVRLIGGFPLNLTSKLQDQASSSVTIGGQTITIDGTQRASALTAEVFFPGSGVFGVTKYGGFPTVEMIRHMRMAEVYLIYAEADARANSTVTPEALAALNAIRARAGATIGGDGFVEYPASITLDEFLTAVRLEKAVELFSEGGQSWFDLVRYAFVDGGFNAGFKVEDEVAVATNPDKFIFPIPFASIQVSNGNVEQNPGY
ncbi:RagB/SusD family nutrient uptake outer membrane protein [Flavivirga eckloniae]|uniref:RagB/SusD family nutrient uptake outer membrane protein n=1 Tax=Flavivirga eckloniae TaxID=1803846 RepID=A0A2K9PPF2_9FLAO|nr:RagB/SusD family nutrient uptake outer membrane protein [Flavivirga eckloniae]AUP78924.1 hypothetical protein C1H87_09510 [Flavivirga eckloniae]